VPGGGTVPDGRGPCPYHRAGPVAGGAPAPVTRLSVVPRVLTNVYPHPRLTIAIIEEQMAECGFRTVWDGRAFRYARR
jgi:hypothetical protein